MASEALPWPSMQDTEGWEGTGKWREEDEGQTLGPRWPYLRPGLRVCKGQCYTPLTGYLGAKMQI